MKGTRAHVIISGKVQGVFFRAETHRAAVAHGIKGWVKNRPEGTVEAVFEAMLEWCKKGSPGARVDDIDVKWDEAREGFIDFKIIY